MSENGCELAIIGGGPAGMAAGLYAARGGLRTVLFEKGLKGGPYAITDEIENYPGFPETVKTEELMDRFASQAARFGLETRTFAPVAGLTEGPYKTVMLEDDDEVTAQAVIIATGANPRTLGVTGEKEFTGRGVSYCATCDGPLFKDKKVLVVGGGNSAIEEAIFLTRFCESVTVVHRRDALRAEKVLQDRAFCNNKITFRWNRVLQEVRGDMLVKEAVLRDSLTGAEETMAADGVFIFVGTSPVTGFLPGTVALDESGFITTGEDLQTSMPGVFAAGDCRRNKLKQIVWAVAEGALAAVMAEKYIASCRQ